MVIFKTRCTIDNSVAYWVDELPAHDCYNRIEGQRYHPTDKEEMAFNNPEWYYNEGEIVL